MRLPIPALSLPNGLDKRQLTDTPSYCACSMALLNQDDLYQQCSENDSVIIQAFPEGTAGPSHVISRDAMEHGAG